jgi:DNA-binding NarL/FixJ family response regulator
VVTQGRALPRVVQRFESRASPEGARSPGAKGGTAINILIVDDHVLFAEVLRDALKARGLDVVGTASSGREGIKQARALKPDVIIMDLGLPDLDGLSAGKRILAESPNTRIIAVTALENAAAVRRTIREGFQGYVAKTASMEQLVGSIMAMSRSHMVLPLDAIRSLLGAPVEAGESGTLAEQLSPRERQVLLLLVEGASSNELARRLFLSKNTVRTHIQNICAKLRVHSRLEAVAFAVKHGIVEDDGAMLPGQARLLQTGRSGGP